MPSETSVFLSYSRKDYYFAESLAFHLLRRGVPAWLDVKDLKPGGEWERDLEHALDAASTLLLVLSPHSLESERVRAEWQHALRRGCRVIVVRFRKAALPPELQSCDAVDFRGSFGRALRILMSRITQATTSTVRATSVSLPALPPWVAVVTLALAVPLLGYFAAATWSLAPETEYRSLVLILAPFGALALAWFFCVSFLRRRMGMTRLGLCLLCLAVVFALPALGYFFRGLSFLATEDVAQKFSRYWQFGVFLLAVPVAGLVILLGVRPEDLLRWTPTGKAWATYRVGHVANAVFGRAELAFQLQQITHFALAFDAIDAPMAQRLRDLLCGLGASESAGAGAPVRQVLLLTNRTRLEWIDAQTEKMRGEGVTVVGTGIDLPPSLDWLWRRQWIDFRGWDIRRTDRALALPQVPDAVTQTRLPTVVVRVRHVLCALAALMFTLGGGVSPDEGRQSEDLSADQVVGMLSFLVAIGWGLIAHRLVKRTRTLAQLVRTGLILCVATIVVTGLDFYALSNGKVAMWRMLIAAAFLLGAGAWLSRQPRILGFWLPQERLTRSGRPSALAKYREWSTVIWSLAYAMVWMALLGFD